jgi:hypothetical protein
MLAEGRSLDNDRAEAKPAGPEPTIATFRAVEGDRYDISNIRRHMRKKIWGWTSWQLAYLSNIYSISSKVEIDSCQM